MVAVSVIIPAYNQGHYVGSAIQSVLDQTFPDYEIVVVDDGSTDRTRDVVAGFSDPRIRYLYQENRGLSAARNTGIRNTTAPFLTFLDSDDLFLPQKLALLVRALENAPEHGMVAGQALSIDANGRQLGHIFDTGLPGDSAQLLLGNPLHVGSVVLRREWQERVGLFDESLRSYEDWDMWLRLARAGCKTSWVARPVSLYRVHPAQMTRNSAQMRAATFAVLDKVYSDPGLPESWKAIRDEAYSCAHLRAAAQAYMAGASESAASELDEAVRLNPKLATGEVQQLAARIAAWARDPRVVDRLGYLERVYDNLPDCLGLLRGHRREELGRLAIELAFQSYAGGELAPARRYVWRAVRYQPVWLRNRGVLSILIRSWLHTLVAAR